MQIKNKKIKEKKITNKVLLKKASCLQKVIKRKKQNAGKENKYHILYSLKAKLILGFLIPVCFVVLVGVYAYQKASAGILKNYENSALQTIRMTTQYMDFGFETIEADSLQMFNDENMVYYALNQYENDPSAAKRTLDYIKNTINMKSVSNHFIENIHMITKEETSCITTAAVGKEGSTEGFYSSFLEEREEALTSKVNSEKWAGTHPGLDERFVLDTDKYICSQYRILASGNAAVVIDVSTEKIQEILESMEIGEGSVIGFVTADGREKVTGEEGFSFLDKEYFSKAVSSEEMQGYQYVKKDGKNQLFMFSKCERNGAVICALVPKALLMVEAEELKAACLLLVVLSAIVVAIVGMMLILHISVNMNQLTKKLSHISEGDLTVDMNISSRSEFGILANYIMQMVKNTGHLIMDAMHIAGNVTESVEEVSRVSGELKASTAGIERSVEEISLGAGQQAQDAEQCLLKMDNLSEIIVETKKWVQEMQEMVANTGNQVQIGNEQIRQLKEKEKETNKITGKVSDWTEELLIKSNEIKEFVDSINDIAEETTLLSLNASIEAARAGDAGRGFAVVAEQIRKLADTSLASSAKVEKVVKEISTMMTSTATFSKEAKKTVEAQDDIVSEVESVFGDIHDCMENVQNNVKMINDSMQEMMKEREETLSSVESISGVLQQTAAASSYVKEMVTEQMQQVNLVEKQITGLQKNSEKMMDTVNQFNVSGKE